MEEEKQRSLGETMKAEREKQRLRVSDLASLANIPVEWLLAMEDDRFGDLPSTTNGHYLVGAYARGLKCDPEPWLNALDSVSPRRRSRRRTGQRDTLLDDRRAEFHRSLVAVAVVAVLWLLYSVAVRSTYRNDETPEPADNVESMTIKEVVAETRPGNGP
jgi:cytoskeletal protein RodZ